MKLCPGGMLVIVILVVSSPLEAAPLSSPLGAAPSVEKKHIKQPNLLVVSANAVFSSDSYGNMSGGFGAAMGLHLNQGGWALVPQLRFDRVRFGISDTTFMIGAVGLKGVMYSGTRVPGWLWAAINLGYAHEERPAVVYSLPGTLPEVHLAGYHGFSFNLGIGANIRFWRHLAAGPVIEYTKNTTNGGAGQMRCGLQLAGVFDL